MRCRTRALGRIVAAATLMAMAEPAFAQRAATAEALFRNGVEDMEAGRYDTGCPAIAESYRLDARPGTLFTLAECEAKAGKLASAVAHYGDYLALFARMPDDQRQRQRGRDAIARSQMDALQSQVPQLIVTLPNDAPPGTLVRMGDIALGAPSLGIPLPVDPGEHQLTTQVPGGRVTARQVTIAAGQVMRVELEVPRVPAAEAGHARERVLQKPPARRPTSTRVDEKDDGETRRVVAYVLGALAVEGLAAGAVTGVVAWQKKGTVDRECTAGACTDAGVDAADSGRTYAAVSTVSFGIGLAALAGAWLAWPGSSREQTTGATVTPTASGAKGALFGVRGEF